MTVMVPVSILGIIAGIIVGLAIAYVRCRASLRRERRTVRLGRPLHPDESIEIRSFAEPESRAERAMRSGKKGILVALSALRSGDHPEGVPADTRQRLSDSIEEHGVGAEAIAMNCPRCQKIVEAELRRKPHRKGGGFHVGAYCPECNHWLTWLRQTRSLMKLLISQEADRGEHRSDGE